MDENILEQADAYAAGAVTEALTKLRHKAPRPADFDGFCSCGAEIPEARLAHDLFNCVGCQTEIERRSKLYGPR